MLELESKLDQEIGFRKKAEEIAQEALLKLQPPGQSSSYLWLIKFISKRCLNIILIIVIFPLAMVASRIVSSLCSLLSKRDNRGATN